MVWRWGTTGRAAVSPPPAAPRAASPPTFGADVAFTLDMPASAVAGGEREMVVLADNRFNSTTAPMHTGGDFWHFGGLMRSVELHTLPASPGVWRAYVLPECTGGRCEAVNITVVLTSKASGTIKVAVAFDGATDATQLALDFKDGVATAAAVPVPDPKLWDFGQPHLHTVTVTANGAGVVERFGLRAFGVDPTTARWTLNGRVHKLHGWNHHTQWPGQPAGTSPSGKDERTFVTATMTDADMDADIALLLAGGTNYVRGAHYPQDPRWLDRLDEVRFRRLYRLRVLIDAGWDRDVVRDARPGGQLQRRAGLGLLHEVPEAAVGRDA